MIKNISANRLSLPILGQGGWNLGDNPENAGKEMAALKRGVDLGMTLIDTAEMYGEGKSEQLIGEALALLNRADYQIVSKVYPHNAGRENIFTSCDDSLKRLKTNYIDLYLLHWRGNIPLHETVECMEELVKEGKIKGWGVSNFDTPDMEDLFRVPKGENCSANQVLYNLGSRGIEYDLLPWLKSHNVAAMAYCPLAQAGSLKRMNRDFYTDEALLSIADKYKITIMQLLLAFVLRQNNLTAIPKAGSAEHIEENFKVLKLAIYDSDWEEIDRSFWPPTTKMHLDIE